MAQYLSQRANETESPMVKEAMLKDANKLNQGANDLIGHINTCLSDPGNLQKAQAADAFVSNGSVSPDLLFSAPKFEKRCASGSQLYRGDSPRSSFH
jgi:hypothetical protein